MSKRRLPPPSKQRVGLEGMKINHYTVGDWCPDQHGKLPAEAVALSLNVQFSKETTADIVFRLKTPHAVDNLIQALLRHKRSVWPDSP